MSRKLTDADLKTLTRLWAKPEARGGWSIDRVKNPDHPFFGRAIAAGYLYRCDSRCGFEAFKDGWVDWTHAGRHAMVVHMVNADPGQLATGGDDGTA